MSLIKKLILKIQLQTKRTLGLLLRKERVLIIISIMVLLILSENFVQIQDTIHGGAICLMLVQTM